jgi:ankyrin repeat protein
LDTTPPSRMFGTFGDLVVEFKADVNDRDDYGTTTLHLAASNGYLEVVKLLVIEFKADVHTKDRCKKTPLHEAVTSGRPRVVSS